MITPLTAADLAGIHTRVAWDVEFSTFAPTPEARELAAAAEHARVRAALCAGGFALASSSCLAVVRALPWDSAHFGVPCADLVRLYAPDSVPAGELDALLARTLDEIAARGVRFVSARLLARQYAGLAYLVARGFRLTDTSVEVGGVLQMSRTESPLTTRCADASDRSRVIEIAGGFTDNRFHHDPHITKAQAQGVYTAWVESALDGRHGRLLVGTRDGQLVGFATYGWACQPLALGQVGLVCVAPEARGQGVLAALLDGAHQQLAPAQLVTSTQVTNRAALRGFGRLGLLPFAARHVLHHWPGRT